MLNATLAESALYSADAVLLGRSVDFFDQFNKANLLDGPTAMRYRRTILEPGASKPAAELVRDFLGRPQNIDALKKWMDVEFQKPGVVAVGVLVSQ